MRGLIECLNWMNSNQDKELKCVDCKELTNRRFRDGIVEFRTTYGYWTKSESLYCFKLYNWEEYDPNPAIDFHLAYMDCLENGNSYKSLISNHTIKNNNGEVEFSINYDGIDGKMISYRLNWSKWQKIL